MIQLKFIRNRRQSRPCLPASSNDIATSCLYPHVQPVFAQEHHVVDLRFLWILDELLDELLRLPPDENASAVGDSPASAT